MTLILGIFTAITSLVAAIASALGTSQKKRIEALSSELEKTNKKLNSARNELYRVYLNVSELLRIEKDLSDELEIGKKMARQGYQTDRYIQPKRVETRIKELEVDIKSEILKTLIIKSSYKRKKQ